MTVKAKGAKPVFNVRSILKASASVLDRCQTVRRFDKRQCVRSLGHDGFCWFDHDAKDFAASLESKP